MLSMISWKDTLLDPNAPDAAYCNKPAIARAVHDGALSEIARLEKLLLDEPICGADRCRRCERVVDRAIMVTDDAGTDICCELCERE